MSPEAIAQARLLTELFGDADEALSDFCRTKSVTDSTRFSDILIQIENSFQKLTELVEEDSTGVVYLSHVEVHVHQSIIILKEIKSEADRGIVQEHKGHHMYFGSKAVAFRMREVVSGFNDANQGHEGLMHGSQS
jgi:hypothetical protein